MCSKLIQYIDYAVSSTETILDAVSSSITTLDTITKQYHDVDHLQNRFMHQVSIVTKTLHDECEEYIEDEVIPLCSFHVLEVPQSCSE